MNISEKIKAIQSVWKQLALLTSWLVAIAGSFLLPLPDWDSGEQQTSNTRFIVFLTTIIAGFVLLITYRYKSRKLWISISMMTFVLLIVFYYIYDNKREEYTLPYYGVTKIVGSVPLEDFETKITLCGLEEDSDELLKCVLGNAAYLWTKDSIDSNRNELKLYLTLCYAILAIFMISFINVIILNTSKNETN